MAVYDKGKKTAEILMSASVKTNKATRRLPKINSALSKSVSTLPSSKKVDQKQENNENEELKTLDPPTIQSIKKTNMLTPDTF